MLPIVLWYGGLLGIGLASLLVLWALALVALKQATDGFPAALLTSGLVLAIASGWAVPHSRKLTQGNQLVKVHEPLMRLAVANVRARATLEDVRAAAEPSSELTAFQSTYDSHDKSIEHLLAAEWQYHRGGPWDEGGLLYKMTWDVHALLLHHARLEKRPEALECPATPAALPLSTSVQYLQDRLLNEHTLAAAVADQFQGYDINAPQSRPVSDATIMRTLAVVLGGLALLSIAAVLLVWRKRSWHRIDALVAVVAIVLVNLAGWLALGAGADEERLREDLFVKAATVFRETNDVNASLKGLMLSARAGVLQPRDSSQALITDYATYMSSANALALLVRIWDRLVLTGTLDTGLVQSERIQTHDDLLNAIRSRSLALYRQYAQLDQRVMALSCRSEWFPRTGDRTLEDELLALPGSIGP